MNQTYSLVENVSKIHGNHTLKFGAQAHLDYVSQNINLISNGEFQFFGNQTGLDFADFLLGLPSTYQQSYTPTFNDRNKYAGVKLQKFCKKGMGQTGPFEFS